MRGKWWRRNEEQLAIGGGYLQGPLLSQVTPMRTIVATQSRVVALNRGIGISRKGLITAPNGIGWECSWSEVREFWIGAIPIPDFALTELNPEFGPRDHFNEPQTDVIVLRLGRDVHRGYDLVVAKNVEWFRKAAEHFGGVNEAPDTNC